VIGVLIIGIFPHPVIKLSQDLITGWRQLF
jgi:hypothetical protein